MMKDVTTPPKAERRAFSTYLQLVLIGIIGYVVIGSHTANAQEVLGNIDFTPVIIDNLSTPDPELLRLQGDFAMFGNNITAIQGSGGATFDDRRTRANPSTNNNGKRYEYVDIDTDPSTFSSSSADFINPSGCSRVAYAGLYWTSTYYIRKSSGGFETTIGLPRTDDRNGPAPNGDGLNAAFGLPANTTFRDIKFKVPPQPSDPNPNYIDISVTETPTALGNRVIFDGWRNTPTNPNNRAAKDIPYLCYANVTDIIQGLEDPEGSYTVANIRSTVGLSSSGVSGGWILVIIYEDPGVSRKLFSSRSGFKQVAGTRRLNFTYSDFSTLPAPNPIRAKYGVAALEGDTGITGDQLRIRDVGGALRRLSTNPSGDLLNEPTNFFDSSISLNGSLTNNINRNPFALNTLGLDIDVFDIANPGNSIIGNDQTSVEFQNLTTGDSYTTFLNTFAVEIIEPELVVKKRVLDASGNDITGDPVGLGDLVRYQLTIQNQGNEGITNAFITDRLPENVHFDFNDPGTFTYDTNIITNLTYDEPTRTLRFEIDDDFVERFDGEFTFEFAVRVIDDCRDITDACSNSIDNVARSTYTGVLSSETRTGEDSILDQDPICRFNIVGTSNVIVGFAELQAECNDAFTAIYCSFPDKLRARGDGFENYNWTNTTTGTFIANARIIDINSPGVYTVVKTGSPDSCDRLEEVWTVDSFGDVDNPIVAIANDPAVNGNIRNCQVNGQPLPELFLCGASASLDLDSGFAGATSVVWQRLDETSCTVPRDQNCPTIDASCAGDWNTVSTDRTFTVDRSGEYRIQVDFDGCPITFYFNVFKNNFDPRLTLRNEITCGAGGRLEVIISPNQYEYELRRLSADGSSSTVVVPYQSSPIFDNLSTQGTYFVRVRLTSSPADCEIISRGVFLPNTDAVVTSTVVNPNCSSDRGTIRLTVTNDLANYTYRIRSTTGTYTAEIPSTIDSSAEFTGLTVGDYDIEVLANDNDNNCLFTQTLTVAQNFPSFTPVATLNRDLSCNPNYQPDPALCALDENDPNFRPCDDDEFIALFEVNVTPVPVPPATENYAYAISSDGGATKTPITPEQGTSNIFRINDATDPGTPTAVGVYTIYVTDLDSGCEEPAGTITVTDYTPIAATSSLTAPTCPGDTGTITVTVTAGEGPFVYVLDAGLPSEQIVSGDPSEINSGSQTFTNLASAPSPGREYTVQVTDRFGCDLEILPNIFIEDPTVITADVAITQEYRCDAAGTGVQTATIEVTNPANGTPPYAYSIDGTDFSNPTGVFTGLTDGTYTLYIRDANTTACPVNLGDQVIDPLNPPTDITYTFPGASSCSAQSISVTPQAIPVGPTYTYSVTPAPISQSSGTFRLRRGETYTFRATNTTTGCIYEEPFTENTLPEIRITTAVETSPVSCRGFSDGEFSFTVTNSTAFDYDIVDSSSTTIISSSASGTDPITVSITSGLAAGTYTIVVRDTSNTPPSNNCNDTATVTITEPTDPLAFTFTTDAADCGASTGIITVNATGGRGGYQYELRDAAGSLPAITAYQTSNVFSGLAGDTYRVYVRDGADATACEVFQDVVLPETAPASIALAGGDLCYDTTDQASRTITVTGGVAPFTYSLNGGAPAAVSFLPAPPAPANTFEIPDLTPGSYTVAVTDVNNCTSNTVSFDIEPELTITATLAKDQDCSASPEATINVTTSGGNGGNLFEVRTSTFNSGLGSFDPFTAYTLYSGPFPFVVTPVVTEVTRYQFKVRDTEGCEDESAEITINPSPTPVASETVTNVSCNGEETGIIDITIDTTVGTGPYEVALNGPTAATTFAASSQTLYAALPAGNYTYQVIDAKECTFTSPTITITEPAAITADDPVATTPISCTGAGTFTYGTATISNVMGGTIGLATTPPANQGYIYTLYDSGTGMPAVNPATTPPPASNPIPAILPSNQQTTTGNTVSFTNLYFGTYYITVEDENGCVYTSSPFRISSPPDQLSATITPAPADCTATGDGAVYDIYIQNGAPPYQIRIVDVPGFDSFVVTNTAGDSPTTPVPPAPYVLNTAPGGNYHRYSGLLFSVPYTIEVVDGGGCLYRQDIAPQPAPSSITASPRIVAPNTEATTDVDCFGNTTGTFDFTVSGYAGNDISWSVFNTATGQPVPASDGSGPSGTSPSPYDGQVTGLGVGSYLVSFFTPSEPFCAFSLSFDITEPSALDLEVISVKDQLCDIGGTPRLGEVVVLGRGGTAPYSYDTNPAGAFANTDGRFALPAGSYDFYVRDANGCTFPIAPTTVSRTINSIPGPSFDAVPTYTDCPFPSAGYSFTVTTTTDGVGNLEYGIAPDDGSGDPFDTEVPAYVLDTPRDDAFTYTVSTPGTYNLYVRDENGCVDTDQIVITPDVFVTATVSNEPTCTAADGEITATVSGGSGVFANLTFDLIDIGTGATLTGVTQTPNAPMNQMVFGNVPPGDYRVEVTDSALPATANCEATYLISIATPVVPTFTAIPEDVSCNGGSDGEIRVTITNALSDQDPPYTYRLFGYDTGTGTRLAQIGGDETDGVFTGLSAGDYDVEVETDSGCIADLQPRTVGEPTAITATPSVGTYTCDAMNNEDFPEVSITIAGGTAPYRISYTAPTAANSVNNVSVVDGDAATAGIQYVFTATESGPYSGITILDDNNCSFTVADAVVDPFPIMSDPTVTQVTAIDCVNGQETVTVSVTGGSAAGNFIFTEILSGVTPAITAQTIAAGTGDNGATTGVETTATFNLPAVGNYQFEIEDVTTGCTIVTTPIYEVSPFNTITVAITNSTDVTCFNSTPQDGSITFAISGHTGTFDYSVTNLTTSTVVATGNGTGATPIIVNDLAAGNIQVEATVTVGGTASTVCIATSNIVNIAPAPVITITTAEQVAPESCVPGDDASIQIAASGGTGALTYKIEQPVGTVLVDYGLNPNSNPGLFTGLDAGATPAGLTYRVFARDSRNCEVFQDVTITPPIPLGVTAPPTVTLDCSDSTDGVITATASGGLGSGAGGTGTGEYFFQLTLPDGTQSTAVPSNGVANGLTAAQHRFIGLSDGAHVITVTDGTVGCMATVNFTVNPPTPVTVEVAPSGFSCLTPNPNTIQVTGAGGAGGYTYFYIEANDATMTEVLGPASGTFTGLPNGDYDFYARDTNGCTSDASDRIPIRTPESLMATLSLNNLNIVCYNEATASIDILNVRGGVGNYRYRIDGIEIQDFGAGPVSTPVAFPAAPNPPQEDSFFSGLRAGTYTYYISSGDCNEIGIPFVVTQPEPFIVPPPTVEDITCNGEVDGRITVTASGGNVADPGNSRYFYSLFDNAGNTIFQFIEDEVDNVLGTHTFEELPAGTYRVEVEDSRGCVIGHDDLEIIEPAAIVASTIDTTPEECAGDSNGTATISITGGTQPPAPAAPEYYYSTTGDDASYQLVADPTNLLITGLAGGTNTIFIRDSRNSSGCELPYNVEIIPGVDIAAGLIARKDCPVIDASGMVTQPTAYYVDFGLTANADPSRPNGVVGPNDIVYTLTGINGTADPINTTNLTGTFEVAPGEYEGTMLHARGCEVSAGTVVVEEYVPLSLPVAVMTGNPEDPNEYEITVTGGIATAENPYVYFAFQGEEGVDPLTTYEAVFDDGSYVLRNTVTQEIVANALEDSKFLVRETDTYTIWVVDATGCSVVSEQDITYINIRIPNYFRPNDPNASIEERFWYPRQITPNDDDPFFFENMEVKVFDRYGRLLEEFKGDQQGWNGIYQGKELPSGDYWFTIILNDVENKEFTGHFTLYR